MSGKSVFALLWLAAILGIIATMGMITVTLIRSGSDTAAPTAGTGTGASAELMTTADEIRPIIAVVDAYRARRQIYPLLSGDLAGRLPADVLVDDIGDTMSIDIGGGRVWVYARDHDGLGYQLIRKLADGGSLIRHQEAGRAVWRFTPDQDEDPAETTIPP